MQLMPQTATPATTPVKRVGAVRRAPSTCVLLLLLLLGAAAAAGQPYPNRMDTARSSSRVAPHSENSPHSRNQEGALVLPGVHLTAAAAAHNSGVDGHGYDGTPQQYHPREDKSLVSPGLYPTAAAAAAGHNTGACGGAPPHKPHNKFKAPAAVQNTGCDGSRYNGAPQHFKPREGNFEAPEEHMDCSALPRVFVGVLSTSKNLQNRQVIRQTWGSNACLVRVIFFVLRPKSGADLLALQREAVAHGDLIVPSEFESYHNITYSTVAVMRAAAALGPQAVDYVIKTDDDVYFRIPMLLQFLVTRPRRGLYAGYPMRPIKSPRTGKSRLSSEAWPHDWTEPYGWGAAIILSIDLAQYMAAGVMHSAMKAIGECEDAEVGIWVAAISHLHHINITYDDSARVSVLFCDPKSLIVHIPHLPGWTKEMRCIHSKGGACCGGEGFVYAPEEWQILQQQKQQAKQQRLQQQAPENGRQQQQTEKQQQPGPAALAAARHRH